MGEGVSAGVEELLHFPVEYLRVRVAGGGGRGAWEGHGGGGGASAGVVGRGH